MKTLDEVIKAFEYTYENDPIAWTYGVDALHYLKLLKAHCDRVQNQIEDLREEYRPNEPLTWNELKDMEGKPIWVEDHNDDDEPYNRWYIVERFIKEQDDEYAVLNDYYFSRKYFNDKTDGWQAYRKERE